MTVSAPPVTLPRPAPAPDAGPLDQRLYDLVEERFRRLLAHDPVFATWTGVHAWDDRLGDGSRDSLLGQLAAEKSHLARVEAIDPAGLSSAAAFERDLEIHNVRGAIFATEELRTWERRSTALDDLGDALFQLFARDFAPLGERLAAITSRLEAVPAFLDQHRTRATDPQVRLWQRVELSTARDLPAFLAEIEAVGGTHLAPPERPRLGRAVATAREAIAGYAAWIERGLADGSDDWAVGRERFDELVRLRALEGLDADAILEIGYRQLAESKAARAAVAREIDPHADEATIVDRVKSNHPATFDEALAAYREAMLRARRHLVERDLVTMPADERIAVIPTPRYLRRVMPFAAYFQPPPLDPGVGGIYVVTPSVGDATGAMREHNYSSISNTGIHEAYPGHHLQLTMAIRHPSLTRLLTDAPEFVEGWGMYSEQMMREEGFDTAPELLLGMHTDAIWRACRIILDVRMHRGEVGVEDAIRFLTEHTSFEEPNARAEVHRYTYTPTYQLSYLLGKVLLLRLRSEQQARLGDRFNLKGFHDALLSNGSLPISFHRRLLDGAG
jgi:uncharacterized protein (DUF885 family)